MSNDEEIGMRPGGMQDADELGEGTDMTLPGSSEQMGAEEGDNGPFVMMDMNLNDDDDGDVPTHKPPRKMTSNSDATSVTAALSLDDGTNMDDSDDFPSKQIKPSLDSLHETADDDCDSSEDSITVESRCWVWFKRILLFFVLFGIVGFAVVMIGARIEKNNFGDAEGTTHLYQMPQVCGVQDPLTDEMGVTFNSAQEAHDAGTEIAHCGDCGSCSSAHDMEIMSRTADSLTKDSTRCAFKIFIGRKAVERCMEERVGFTPACEDCWLDNIACSFKSCKFTCIKYKLFRQDNNKGDELNDCLKCDERMCGPQFIECSGANRRRMGIVSDIGRNADTEQCKDADVDWTSIFDN